jgi:hypothetical protein
LEEIWFWGRKVKVKEMTVVLFGVGVRDNPREEETSVVMR